MKTIHPPFSQETPQTGIQEPVKVGSRAKGKRRITSLSLQLTYFDRVLPPVQGNRPVLHIPTHGTECNRDGKTHAERWYSLLLKVFSNPKSSLQ